MQFRVLGRLEVLDGEVDVTPRRAQPRALLAAFLLHPGERLTTDRLIEAVWGETPPATAEKALQGHVSALRKVVGAHRIRTTPGAYTFDVAPGELDAEQFAVAVTAAREHRDARERSQALSSALALWQGDALSDVDVDPLGRRAAERLESLRLAAAEAWAEAELALGRHAEILPALERLLARSPLSEGLRASLMLALYRSSRQADALRVYREGRRLLAEELGIDPGAELQQLEQRVLAQDPGLAAPAPSETRSDGPRQERKTVTVLVIEVAPGGPTDPEDLEGAAAPALARIRAAVERVGGRSEPLFANALVGIFGAPRTHEDDAVRAIRAALDILAGDPGNDIRLRGGIETGQALVTVDGGEVSVTGQVLAAASHLQAVASVDSIVVGPATRRATEGRVEYEQVGDDAWTPRALRPSAADPEPRFLGRRDELAQLERIFARARDEPSVQLVTLLAEPGAGKSRLARELRARLEPGAGSPGMRWLQGRCLPYGDGLTFWALGEIAKDWAGILESDDAATSSDKLAAALAAVEPSESERAWLMRSVAPLVGIEGSATADRERGFAAWRQLIEAIAAERPTCLVFEDVHWADEALLAFLDHLVDRAADVPLLVLCTARPELLEIRPTWAGGKRDSTTLLVQPLSDPDTSALLRDILGREPEREWVRRAGGNPLYAQELARLIARQGDPQATAIPESLQAVIAAHLDTLTPDLKSVAVDAAVVGEVFWPGAVAAIGGLDPSVVDARLQRLIANELVRRRRRSSVAGEEEYEFLHVLVRDVAYGQIPRRDRVAKHRAAAAWIERLASDRTAAHAELLAHHALEAFELAQGLGPGPAAEDLREPAVRFLALAGDAARPLDVVKAGTLYQQALDISAPTEALRPGLLARLGDVAQLSGQLDIAERLTREAIAGLAEAGDAKAAGATRVVLESVLWRLARPEEERRRLLAEAIHLLEPLPPSPELVQAYAQMAAHSLYHGSSGECAAWSAKALRVAESLAEPALLCQPRLYLGIARFEQGDVAGIDDVRAAVDIGLQAGLTWETAHAMADLGAIVWLEEGPGQGIPLKTAAASFAESRGMTALAQTTRAQMLWFQYDIGAWDDLLEAAEDLAASAGEQGGRITMLASSSRARVLVARGRGEAAVALEPAILALAREIGDAQDVVPALATAACIRAAVGDTDTALSLIAEMEERSRGRDLSRRAHDLPPVARICVAAGAPELARSFLTQDIEAAPTRARLAVAATRALVAEAAGDLRTASSAYADVAHGWATYGCPEEEAYALLGRGRCLIGEGAPAEAVEPLRRAAEVGAAMGAVTIAGSARALLAEPATTSRDRRST